VVPGLRQSAFVLLNTNLSDVKTWSKKGYPTHPSISHMMLGLVQKQKSILDIFFRPERSTALAFDWNLLTDWWSVGTSQDGGSRDGGEIPKESPRGIMEGKPGII